MNASIHSYEIIAILANAVGKVKQKPAESGHQVREMQYDAESYLNILSQKMQSKVFYSFVLPHYGKISTEKRDGVLL